MLALLVVAALSIRGVDFANFTYQYNSCDISGPMKMHGREYLRTVEGSRIDATISKPQFGSLAGNEAAVVVMTCNTGGSGFFTEGYIYRMHAGKAALLTMIPGGDRADGGIVSASIKAGRVVVERYGPENADGSPACCPAWIVTTWYRWNGHNLIVDGPSRRRRYVSP